MKSGFVPVVLLFLHSSACADTLFVRPQAGYGYLDSRIHGGSGNVYHVGARLLLDAGEVRRYGLELSRFSIANGEDFTSLGIVLEQRLWDWFNMSIGTVGYSGYGMNSDNIAGLMTNLGWEPNNDNGFKPFITYRNDVIFSEDIGIAYSISAGFTFDF